MAKKTNKLPEHEEVDFSDEMTMDNIVPLLRAAIGGDEHAKKVVLSFLDFYEQHKEQLDMIDRMRQGNPDEVDEDFGVDYPLTLPRKEVKEYHVRIKLNNIDLKIWREVKVPSNITLQALGELLLEVMGWMLEHLYQFRIKDTYYCSKQQIDDSMFPENDRDYSKVTLSDVLTEKGVRMKLEYDFGDSWEHDVWVKGIREYAKGEKPSITFVTGQGECPPEDCGGVWGYTELLELTKKQKLTKEERERLKWYEMDSKSGFDPDFCDIDYFEEVAEDYNDALDGQ